jgi:hypothetical protein
MLLYKDCIFFFTCCVLVLKLTVCIEFRFCKVSNIFVIESTDYSVVNTNKKSNKADEQSPKGIIICK